MKWFSVFFLVGIAIQIFIVNFTLYIALFIASGCLYLNIKKKYLTTLCFIGYGIFYACLHGYLIDQQTLDNNSPENTVILEGTINSLPNQGNFGQYQFIFEPINREQHPKRILVSWNKPQHTLLPGQQWQLALRVRPVHGLKNPHGFDYERYLITKNIGATAKVNKSTSNKLLDQQFFNIHKLRYQLRNSIYKVNTDDRMKGLLSAMLIGDRHGIAHQDKELFKLTGISHLIAISGLHIGLVSSLLLLLMTRVGRYFPQYLHKIPVQLFAAFVALLGAAAYAMIAGFSLPTERALLLLMVATLALFLYQRWNSFNLLSVVCMLVLLINPYSIISASFWLSFFAVFCILWLNQYTAHYKGWRKWLVMQTGLVVLITPISCWYFGQASIIAPLTNAIAIPVIGFLVIPIALTGLLVSLILPSLGAILITLAAKILALLVWIIESINQLLNISSLQISPNLAITVISTVVLLALFTRGIPYKWLLGSVLLVAMLPLLPRPLEKNSLKVHFFDVGQGLSILVETPTYKLLYDTGPKHGLNSAMQSQIIPYLKSRHINMLDAVVISHDDTDHSGGLEALLHSNINVKQFYTSTVIENNHSINSTLCRIDQGWIQDHATFLFLHPSTDVANSDNDMSCVLSINTDTHKILLTGDISKHIEAQLVRLNRKELANVDLLSIPHHGSNTSSSDEFVNLSNSRYAVASSSRFNQWSFPKDQVVQRYLNAGTIVEQTALSGMISFEFTEGIQQPIVQRYRDLQQKIW